jgi:transcriptional regulator with XRE-family HTH domain
VRYLLSDFFKSRIRSDARSQAELATLANLSHTQLSWFMHDRVGIGLVCRLRLLELAKMLGVPESRCFKEVRR